MTQTKIDTELLIPLVENRPIIWDKTLENYKNKNLRTAAWREVCIILNEDFEKMEEKERQDYAKTVVKKWNQTRDSWSRNLNTIQKTKKSGSASVNVKKYRYHNQLSFLKKVKDPAETHDSANDTETNQDQDNTDIENDELENSTTQNKENEHETAVENESPNQENSISSAKRFKKRDVPRQKLNVMDQKMMSYIDYQMKTQNNSQNEDRNLSFFKSLLPTVALLNDDQILQFQAGVISLLQNIKSQQPSTSNYLYQSPGYFTPQYRGQSSPSTSIQSTSQSANFQPSPNESSRSDFPDFTLM